MKLTLALLLVFIFFLLSTLHFYWAVGGQWGYDQVLPANEQGVRLLNPTSVDSLIVGSMLLICGLFYLLYIGLLKVELPAWILSLGLWGIPIVFTLRAFGDFKYIGFFKKVKATEFAHMDTLFYSPLCLTVALIGFALIRWK